MGIRLLANGPRGGRITPKDQIDFELVKQTWKRCEYNTPVDTRDFQYPLRVIDVEDFRVVNLEPGGRYVALSYVWGEAKQLCLTKMAKEGFCTPMGLLTSFDRIPRTVKDAIKLVFEVEERSLWFDNPCITQDDDEDKLEQVMQMGDICGGAALTISAASGNHTDEGIPGVQPRSRKEWWI